MGNLELTVNKAIGSLKMENHYEKPLGVIPCWILTNNDAQVMIYLICFFIGRLKWEVIVCLV